MIGRSWLETLVYDFGCFAGFVDSLNCRLCLGDVALGTVDEFVPQRAQTLKASSDATVVLVLRSVEL